MQGQIEDSDLKTKLNDIIVSVKSNRTGRKRRSKIIPTISDELTIAAYDASRQIGEVGSDQGKVARYGSSFVLVCTICAPFAIFWRADAENHSYYWDLFGIFSTFLLVFMVFFWEIFSAASKEIFGLDNESESLDRGLGATRLILMISLAIFCSFAVYNIRSAHLIEISVMQDFQDLHYYHGWHVVSVFCISIVFILMDASVANTSQGHRASFAAVSSLTHSSAPMCIGVFIIGVWYMLGHFFGNVGEDQKFHQFVTGALTFQIITSNILFITINENMVFRFSRWFSYSTVSP